MIPHSVDRAAQVLHEPRIHDASLTSFLPTTAQLKALLIMKLETRQ
jgi:hypothetical protein